MSQNSIILPTTGTVSGLQMAQYTNQALDTLNTQWAGAGAPASPEAFQFWVDTSNSTLYQRNSANNAWNPIGTVDVANLGLLPTTGGTLTGELTAPAFVGNSLSTASGVAQMLIQNDNLVSFTNLAGSAGIPVVGSAFRSSGSQLLIQNSTVVNCTNIAGSANIPITASAFTVSSDYRLKCHVEPLAGALDRLGSVPVHRFNWNADPGGNKVDGFLAHEVQAGVPEAIFGEKDAVDEEGKPVHQRIDQSKLVPILWAAVQELAAKVAALEAKGG